MAAAVGELVGQGSRSRVHTYGRGAVAKLPERSTPDSWIAVEATYGEAARLAGAPVPALLGTERVDGRLASIWQHVQGPSLWTWATAAGPERLQAAGVLLADVQVGLFDLVPPLALPRQHDRLVSKIRRAAELVDADLAHALALVPPPAAPVRLCHGDLHPGNLILSPDGPVVVDWFDASRGDPLVDIGRSVLTMLPDRLPDGLPGQRATGPTHLPGGGDSARAAVARSYREQLAGRTSGAFPGPDGAWARALAVGAAARVAEGVDPAPLLQVWADYVAGRSDPVPLTGALVHH